MPDQTTPIRDILLLEDSADDAELLAIELEALGLRFVLRQVMTEADFRAALAQGRPDLIVSDSNLPGFSGDEAFSLSRELSPATPFLFLTGMAAKDAQAGSRPAPEQRVLSKDAMGEAAAEIARSLG